MSGDQYTDAPWDDVGVTTQRLTRLVRIESQRRVTMNTMFPAAKAVEFARAIVISVLNHVPDPAIRARIEADVVTALGEGNVPAAVDC
jgi:hypothetical protein